MADTFWTHAARYTVIAILLYVALLNLRVGYRRWKKAQAVRKERLARLERCRMRLAIADFLLEAEKFAASHDDDAKAFALDEVPLDLSA